MRLAIVDLARGTIEYSELDYNDGPCYDLCDCRRCWNGWTDFSFWQRLRWRIAAIVRRRSLK